MAEDRPLVTFFVTGYEQEDTIRAAIEGAFAQTWSPLEIVLSDDCSSDRTFAIMQEMAAAHEGPHEVRAIRTPGNRGIVGNVNHVMAESRGALVVMAGGDDVSAPDRSERLAEAWLASGRRAHLLHSAAEVIDAAGETVGRRDGAPALIAAASPTEVLSARRSVLGATAAWSRRLFDVFGPIPSEALVEDPTLTFRAAFLGPILYLDEPLVRWREGGVSWRPPRGDGREMLYGTDLKLDRWRAAACRVALAEMARVDDLPGEAAFRDLARRQAETCGLRVALADAGSAGRLALLPKALAMAARRRSAQPLVLAAKYLLEGSYIRYWDARHGGRAEGEAAS